MQLPPSLPTPGLFVLLNEHFPPAISEMLQYPTTCWTCSHPPWGLSCVGFVLAPKLRTVELFPFPSIFLWSAAAHSLQSEMLSFWGRIWAGDRGAEEPVGLHSSSFSFLHYLCSSAQTRRSSLLHKPGLVCTSLVPIWTLRSRDSATWSGEWRCLWELISHYLRSSVCMWVGEVVFVCLLVGWLVFCGGVVGKVKNRAAILIFFSYNLQPKYLSSTDCASWNLGICIFAVVDYEFFANLVK